jgi:leucine dehydrogenase
VGADIVPADRVVDAHADVYAPCAVGGVLSIDIASRIDCRVVAGSANNQLARPDAADVLQARGILYAPDYVLNAGGGIALVGREQLGWSDFEVEAALARIGETLREVYRRSEEQGISTGAAAEALADERLESS